MDKRTCRRYLRVAVLLLTIALIATMSGVIRNPSVDAQGPAGLPQTPQTVQGATDLMRRPRVKFSDWIGEGGADRWRIGDRILRVDSDSPLKGSAQVGKFATVIARVDDQDVLHAEGISLEPPSGLTGYAIEFRCLIQEVNWRYWVVCNRVVLITENTSIQGRPEIGALAEVKGTRLTGNAVLARIIKVAVPEAFAEVEFEGAIESLAQDAWVVSGNTVTISPVTEISGVPEIGLQAEVKGVLQPDGSVLAIQITVKDLELSAQINLEGLVEQIEDDWWVVAGTKVFIDGNTFIDDGRAPAEVGMWAQIRALRRQDQSLLALRIRLSRPD